jgi:hypothetical protein
MQFSDQDTNKTGEETFLELASLSGEKEQLGRLLNEERDKTKEIRNLLWREQNLRIAAQARVRELEKRVLEIKELVEAHLDVLLLQPALLSALKSKV